MVTALSLIHIYVLVFNPNTAWDGNAAELSSLLKIDKEAAPEVKDVYKRQGLGSSYMARKAAKQLMQRTGADPDDIDLVLSLIHIYTDNVEVGSSTLPGTTSKLKAEN